MKILRVFPQRTSYTPTDDLVCIGAPPGLLIPPHDEVHISCTFTWDKDYCEDLRYQWEAYTDKPVRLGGPAYASPVNSFTPGLYVRNDSNCKIAFTSRGCNNNCPWCCVPSREGRLRELPVVAGNVIQDNNFLQCSRRHKDNVFKMLKGQRGICFKGGLEADLIDDHFVEAARGVRTAEIWLACDTDGALPAFRKAMSKLRPYFSRDKVRCYVLIGGDMDKNEARLREIYHEGAMPFAQLFQPLEEKRKEYSPEWKKFHRMWSRPAATVAHVERGTNMMDFNT